MAKKAKKIELLSAVPFATIGASGAYVFVVPETDVVIKSADLAAFNATLEKLGYKAVHVTTNILNPAKGSFLIDADTPWCCNPGSEAYHSM